MIDAAAEEVALGIHGLDGAARGGECDHVDMVFGVRGVDVGAGGVGGSGADAPESVAEEADAVGIFDPAEEGLGAFEGVVVVFENELDAGGFIERDPVLADARGDRIGQGAVGGIGGNMVDGDEVGNGAAFVEGSGEPLGLRIGAGDERAGVLGVGEEEREVGAEVEGAVGCGGTGKGEGAVVIGSVAETPFGGVLEIRAAG